MPSKNRKKFHPRLPLPKKTERVHKDKTLYDRSRLRDERLLEDARDILWEQRSGIRNNEE
jgi:hypothetical protein